MTSLIRHIRRIGREAESGGGGDSEVQHTGAEPATRIAGRERWEWRPTILARSAIVPRTSLARMCRIPTVCPRFSFPVGSTPQAQTPPLRVGRRDPCPSGELVSPERCTPNVYGLALTQ